MTQNFTDSVIDFNFRGDRYFRIELEVLLLPEFALLEEFLCEVDFSLRDVVELEAEL